MYRFIKHYFKKITQQKWAIIWKQYEIAWQKSITKNQPEIRLLVRPWTAPIVKESLALKRLTIRLFIYSLLVYLNSLIAILINVLIMSTKFSSSNRNKMFSICRILYNNPNIKVWVTIIIGSRNPPMTIKLSGNVYLPIVSMELHFKKWV